MVNFINKHKIVRRLLLVWAVTIITIVLLRATEPEVLKAITTAGGVVVSVTVGILATVLGLYQHHRSKDGD